MCSGRLTTLDMVPDSCGTVHCGTMICWVRLGAAVGHPVCCSGILVMWEVVINIFVHLKIVFDCGPSACYCHLPYPTCRYHVSNIKPFIVSLLTIAVSYIQMGSVGEMFSEIGYRAPIQIFVHVAWPMLRHSQHNYCLCHVQI